LVFTDSLRRRRNVAVIGGSMKILPFIMAAATLSVSLAEAASSLERYCNPIPLPDYPVGVRARDLVKGTPAEPEGLWLLDLKEQYRELADPSALWHEGKWSGCMRPRTTFASVTVAGPPRR
jgi:hypothetical protein